MQMEMLDRIEAGRDCVNVEAPARISRLIHSFRQRGSQIVHVRHRDDDPESPLYAGALGYAAMPGAEGISSEPVFVKRGSSAFASTGLAAYLCSKGITDLIVAGAVAGFCVNTTVRDGADLGFNMTVIQDAVIGFDLPAAGLSARLIFDVTMALLEADFAKVIDTNLMLSMPTKE